MVPKYLPVIDSRRASWKAQVDRQMDLGSNFLFIVPATFPHPIAHALGATDSEAPPAMDTVDLLPLAHYLHPRAVEILKAAWEEGAAVHFVKQLQFPPRVGWAPNSYLLYCGARGIISRHENFSEAREACLREYQHLLFKGEFPEVGLYQWSERAGLGAWGRVFAPSADAWLTGEVNAGPLTLAPAG